MTSDRLAAAARLMTDFTVRTGLTAAGPPRRYLWTDAFGVCTCLALYQRTGEARWCELALALIHQVHHVLGRHRADDERTGWLSGLADGAAERHPTVAGLRIGKPLPERPPGEPEDQVLDWDRDGQYYHYLTRWLHALRRAGTALDRPQLLEWGAELASTMHQAFAHGPPPRRQLYWKLSIDLAHPVVETMGQHDALDGLVATAAIRDALLARDDGARAERSAGERLGPPLAELGGMCAGRGWVTPDALGIGMLLVAALELARLAGRSEAAPEALFARVLHDSARSLDLVTTGRFLAGPAQARLAFRELGLATGLAAAERLAELQRAGQLLGGLPAEHAVARLQAHLPLRRELEEFWLDPRHQHASSWVEHEDINAVMLATSLVPEGLLA